MISPTDFGLSALIPVVLFCPEAIGYYSDHQKDCKKKCIFHVENNSTENKIIFVHGKTSGFSWKAFIKLIISIFCVKNDLKSMGKNLTIVGIIGAGMIAEKHIAGLQKTGRANVK